MNDQPLKKSAKPDANSADRTDRTMQDRAITENRELSDDDRVEMLRSGFLQTKLPNLPEIPGYHVCWLSTTNASDTIAWRQQIGYELLKPADVPGWIHGTCSHELFSGYVGVNEMIGAKIRKDLYDRVMRTLHHDEPAAMEAGIRRNIDGYAEDAESSGGRIEMEEGTARLGKHVEAPRSW